MEKECVLLLPSACLLVPTTIKTADYQKVVANPSEPLIEEKGTISLRSGFAFDDAVKAVTSVFRSFVVQQSPKACILFCRSFQVTDYKPLTTNVFATV